RPGGLRVASRAQGRLIRRARRARPHQCALSGYADAAARGLKGKSRPWRGPRPTSRWGAWGGGGSAFFTGKNRKRFFRYRAFAAGGKRGFCRLPPRVATPYFRRMASALSSGEPMGPSAPIEVVAPVFRLTRYNVDCAV